MPGYPSISTRIIGQTEKTLNAILDRQLDGTGLTEAQWVILTLTVTSAETPGIDPRGGSLHRGRLPRLGGHRSPA
jgi:hypothetical protein